jgi:hypothetical protein
MIFSRAEAQAQGNANHEATPYFNTHIIPTAPSVSTNNLTIILNENTKRERESVATIRVLVF